MSITRGVRWFIVVAGLVSVVAAPSHGAHTNPPPDPSADRPVVVRVSDSGFHWVDAGIGAAAALATTLLALGLVLALRPDCGTSGNPRGACVSARRRGIQ